MRSRPLALIVVAAALVVAGTSSPAVAYPQFQFSSGTSRCNQCHFAPAGGGLINGWGRSEAGDTISRGGDGGFLHGAWKPPPWLGLGGDFRAAFMNSDVGDPDGSQKIAFPMQGDVYLRLGARGFSLNGIAGMRAVARNDLDRESPVDQITDTNRYISREHYLMWQPAAIGPYLRAGRFVAPYGLRLVEHIAYPRRYLGFGLFEETYGLAGGTVKPDWEVHATLFVPSFHQPVGYRERGVAVYYERRLREKAALGAQVRAGLADDERRFQGGISGKLWVERAKLLLMSQGDFIRQQFTASGLPGRNQLVGYLSGTLIPTRGLLLGLNVQHFDEDLAIKDVARDAVGTQINFFPWAHVEVVGLARLQVLGLDDGGYREKMAMIQLHYYL